MFGIGFRAAIRDVGNRDAVVRIGSHATAAMLRLFIWLLPILSTAYVMPFDNRVRDAESVEATD